jgi:hypothetical protein
VKAKSLFALGPDGGFFVDASAVMGPHALLIVCNDGTPFVYFGRKDGPYLGIDNAISWAERECRENPGWAASLGDGILRSLRLAKQKFDAGKATING